VFVISAMDVYCAVSLNVAVSLKQVNLLLDYLPPSSERLQLQKIFSSVA